MMRAKKRQMVSRMIATAGCVLPDDNPFSTQSHSPPFRKDSPRVLTCPNLRLRLRRMTSPRRRCRLPAVCNTHRSTQFFWSSLRMFIAAVTALVRFRFKFVLALKVSTSSHYFTFLSSRGGFSRQVRCQKVGSRLGVLCLSSFSLRE